MAIVKLYVTRADAIAYEILPALAGYADEYDIGAIADAVIGRTGDYRYYVRTGVDFWHAVQAAHMGEK